MKPKRFRVVFEFVLVLVFEVCWNDPKRSHSRGELPRRVVKGVNGVALKSGIAGIDVFVACVRCHPSFYLNALFLVVVLGTVAPAKGATFIFSTIKK